MSDYNPSSAEDDDLPRGWSKRGTKQEIQERDKRAIPIEKPSLYIQHAELILGRKPKLAPLPVLTIHERTGKVFLPQGFAGDLAGEDDRRLCVLVDLPLAQWDRLSETERLPFMEKALNLRQLVEANSGKHTAKTTAKSEVSLDAKALGVFIEHNDWTKKQIAKLLGCHEKSLCPKRCPKLAAAMIAYSAPESVRRGSKDRDGNLEAWNDE